MTSIPLTETALRAVKRALVDRFPTKKSAHLTEALAAACGYNSQASLLKNMKNVDLSDPDYVLLDKKKFLHRLEAIEGISLDSFTKAVSFDLLKYPPDVGIIRTFSKHRDSITYSKSKRLRAWRNMMVAGINAGLKQKIFGLRPGDNRWSEANSERREVHVYQFYFGNIEATASVHDAGFDELSIHVAMWPNPNPDFPNPVRAGNAGFHAGEAFATGWLERRSGAWLQVTPSGCTFCCKRNRLGVVAALAIEPDGYADRGSFKM